MKISRGRASGRALVAPVMLISPVDTLVAACTFASVVATRRLTFGGRADGRASGRVNRGRAIVLTVPWPWVLIMFNFLSLACGDRTGTKHVPSPFRGCGSLIAGWTTRGLRQEIGGRNNKWGKQLQRHARGLQRMQPLVGGQQGRTLNFEGCLIFPHITVLGCGMEVNHEAHAVQCVLVNLMRHNGLNDIGIVIK